MIKKWRFLILALVFSLLASCANPSPAPLDTNGGDTQPDAVEPLPIPLSSFQLVRPDRSSKELTDAIVSFNAKVKEQLGEALKIRLDILSERETAYEILIGNCENTVCETVYATLADGDYGIQTVAGEDNIKIVVYGYDEFLTLRAFSKLEALLDGGSFIDDGMLVQPNLKCNYYNDYANFTLKIGDPILVTKGASYAELGWGPYQFPNLFYTQSGSIICRWHTSNDKIYGGIQFDIPSSAVSDDGGLTWRKTASTDLLSYESRALMQNGKYFAGFGSMGAYEADYLDNYNPLYTTKDGTKLYSATVLKELDKAFSINEYDPVTQKVTNVPCKINWPNMLVSVHDGNIVYPPQKALGIAHGLGDLATEDALYFCTYSYCLDSQTGKVGKYTDYRSVVVLRSTDSGRNWDLVSQISINDDVLAESQKHSGSLEGFNEPMMEQMSDGSIVMLMRTGSNQPCYLVRSTDGCKTWSKPVKFDEVGVRPFIMRLDCGVTLSTYGRDGLFIRGTSDPSGLEWQDPIEILFNRYGGTKSCYYTYMLPLDRTTAILVHSYFYYTESSIVESPALKSVVVRMITVEPAPEASG